MQKAQRLHDAALAFAGGEQLQNRIKELMPVQASRPLTEAEELEAGAKVAEELGQRDAAKQIRDRAAYLKFCKGLGIKP